MTAQTPPGQLLPNLQRSAANIFTPVHRELDRIFDQLGSGWAAFSEMDLTPRMDLVETRDAFELTFELPGMSRSDVRIAMEDDLLVVSGEKKAEKETKDRNGRVLERSYGRFERSVTLPRRVDAERIKASMANGVLKVVAPKQAGPEPRTIEIQGG